MADLPLPADETATPLAPATAVDRRDAEARAAALSVRGLGKRVPLPTGELTILDGITFTIDAGDTIAIVGASGSGKSTLLSLMAGLDTPSSGDVELDGESLSTLDEDGRARVRGEKVGFVFQNFQLLPSLTALENVMLPLELRGDRDAEGPARAILEQVGLGERLGHYPRQLSGGEQQRVALARAFVTRPSLLFADEPTGNLDSKTTKEVMHMIRGFAKRFHQTIVLVSHDPEMTEYADRIVTLIDGRIVSNVENQVKAEIDAAPYIE